MTKCNVPTFRSPLNNLFDSFFSDALPEAYPGCHCPATDIQETAQSFAIALDLPGVAEASNLAHCKQGYFGRTGNALVPIGPAD